MKEAHVNTEVVTASMSIQLSRFYKGKSAFKK